MLQYRAMAQRAAAELLPLRVFRKIKKYAIWHVFRPKKIYTSNVNLNLQYGMDQAEIHINMQRISSYM